MSIYNKIVNVNLTIYQNEIDDVNLLQNWQGQFIRAETDKVNFIYHKIDKVKFCKDSIHD